MDIKGTLKFSGELTFDGKLDGDISSEGTLNLGDNAVIKGNINATSVIVRGKITGNVIAREKIDIKARTELFGDIKAPRLAIEEGVTSSARPTSIRTRSLRPRMAMAMATGVR